MTDKPRDTRPICGKCGERIADGTGRIRVRLKFFHLGCYERPVEDDKGGEA